MFLTVIYISTHALIQITFLGLLCCHGTKVLLREKDGRDFNYQNVFPEIGSNAFDVFPGTPTPQAAASQLSLLHGHPSWVCPHKKSYFNRKTSKIVRLWGGDWRTVSEFTLLASLWGEVWTFLLAPELMGPTPISEESWRKGFPLVPVSNTTKRRNSSPWKAGICLIMHHEYRCCLKILS